jgi:hypothetical protein
VSEPRHPSRLATAGPIAFLVSSAYFAGVRTEAGQWLSAAIDAAVTSLMIYVLLRDPRRPKGTRMALLSKEAIFAQNDQTHEDVEVPEWGGTVRIRSLTGEERDAYEASMVQQVGKKAKANLRNMRAKLVAMSAINEDGTQQFDQADVMRLGQSNAAALDRLFEAAQRLSGLSDEDVKEMEEGFEPAPNGASTSGSPSPSASPSASSSPAPAPVSSPSTWPTNGTPGLSVPPVPTSTPR